LIPLVAGILEPAYFTVVGPPHTTGGQTIAYVAGFGLILVGLICAGPWLTMSGARLTARRARRPAALLAGRRLADNPQAGFRAISGLVLALFVTSVSVGVITTLVASAGPSSGTAAANTLVNYFWRDSAGQLVSSVPFVPASTISNLSAIDGVTGVTLVHQFPSARRTSQHRRGSSCAHSSSTHRPSVNARGARWWARSTARSEMDSVGKQPSIRPNGRLLRLPQRRWRRCRCMSSSSA
jgi:hypothetical protein